MRTTKLNVTEFTILVSLIVVTKMTTFRFLRSVLLRMRDRSAEGFCIFVFFYFSTKQI